jgi:hypothetical protein
LVRTGIKEIVSPCELIFLQLTEKPENEMGEECGVYGGEEGRIQGFGGET